MFFVTVALSTFEAVQMRPMFLHFIVFIDCCGQLFLRLSLELVKIFAAVLVFYLSAWEY